MSTSPKIFISATSSDLSSARQAVKETLLEIGYHPVEQTNFGLNWRKVNATLHERISTCQALIHIVGLRYGPEPNPAKLPKGTPRHSYAQLEYHIGRELEQQSEAKLFRVYTFVCPETFPYDPSPADESESKRALQDQHRLAILRSKEAYEMPCDLTTLRGKIRNLRKETARLQLAQRHRTQLKWGGVTLLLILLLGMAYIAYRGYVVSQTLNVATPAHNAPQLELASLPEQPSMQNSSPKSILDTQPLKLRDLPRLLYAARTLLGPQPEAHSDLLLDNKQIPIRQQNPLYLNVLAQLLQATDYSKKAESLMRQMLAALLMAEAGNNQESAILRTAINNYVQLLSLMGWPQPQIAEQLTKLRQTHGLSATKLPKTSWWGEELQAQLPEARGRS